MALPIHSRRAIAQPSAACGVGTAAPTPPLRPGRPHRPLRRLAAAAAGLLLLGSLAVLPSVWARWLAPPWGEVAGQPDPGCDVLQQACRVPFADGSLAVVRVRAEALQDGAALALTVRFDGAPPRAVDIDLDGESMAMGSNHNELKALADGRWTGHTSLSACVSGRMAWILTLRAPVGGGVRVARLRFETGSP